MKTLFSRPGRYVRYADEKHTVFDFSDGHFYDLKGVPVPYREEFRIEYDPDDWGSPWAGGSCTTEELHPDSVTEVEWEIDDGFGKFGFRNKEGDFVIEPQYAYAYDFTQGLAAVNLDRTWYRSKEGNRYYENHFGYINERGETVIPFAYDEAYPFNKYSVAVVEDKERAYLIDTEGKVLSGTEEFVYISHYYEYNDRFFEFSYMKEADEYDYPVGIYDTMLKKIILEPSISEFTDYEDKGLICVTERNGDHGISDFHMHYIDLQGNIVYPWLKNKGFAHVGIPDAQGLSVVSLSEYRELSSDAGPYFFHDGKKYDRKFRYGLYSPKEKFNIPPEYDSITCLGGRIYGQAKDGMMTIIEMEDSDLQE